eukprot:1134237-Pelagomonas_calceolata.AAC.1
MRLGEQACRQVKGGGRGGVLAEIKALCQASTQHGAVALHTLHLLFGGGSHYFAPNKAASISEDAL